MSVTLLKKLQGRSAHELYVRGAQEFAKLTERLSSTGSYETALADEFPATKSAKAAAVLLLERLHRAPVHTFFPSFANRTGLTAMLNERFATEQAALIAHAERLCAGRFDLLGLTDLNFGEPPDWHLEPLSGKRTPLAHWAQIDFLDPEIAGDKKVTWELNRQQFFVTLGQAYWLTGDEKYAERFVVLASSWLEANPPKRGINWASSLELAFRVISWLWALHLCADFLTPAFTARFLASLIAQGRHIETYLSHYFSPNTHLTGEALALFYLGVALPELRCARRWRELGLRILLEQLPQHLPADGVYFERSTYYHRYTVDFYLHLYVLAQANDIALPPVVAEKLTAACEHLQWITRPDGSSPFMGDDDGGRLLPLHKRCLDDFRDTLATGAALFGHSDWKFVAGAAAVETLWLLGPEGVAAYDKLAAVATQGRARAHEQAGFYVMRNGWTREANYVLISSGPSGELCSAHAHDDALSFEFAAAGVNWLVDPGTFTYTGDRIARDWFRTGAGHNTVLVDGATPAVPAGPFSWQRKTRSQVTEFAETRAGLIFTAAHDGYERFADPVRHTRRIVLPVDAGACLIICDEFTAQAEHRYELRFHLAPECEAVINNDRIVATASNGVGLTLISFAIAQASLPAGLGKPLGSFQSAPPQAQQAGLPTLPAHLEQGWVSRGYGQRAAAPVASFLTTASGNQRFITLAIAAVQGQQANVETLLKKALGIEQKENSKCVASAV